MTPPSVLSLGDDLTPEALRVLVVHGDIPPIDRDACSQRISRIVELLVQAGHKVTFLGRAGFGQDREAERLHAAGVERVITTDRDRLLARHGNHPALLALPPLDFSGLLASGCFDLAWLSLYDVAEQYLPLIRAASPATRIIVDSSDVQWIREARGAHLSGREEALAAAMRTRARERAVYAAADANVAISEADAQATQELAPNVPVHIVSQVQPFPDAVTADPADRSGLLFVGNFRHAPNVDAVLHFADEIWPLVRAAVPGVQLTIVGTEPPVEVQAMAAADVTVAGSVPDLNPYLAKARVSIAPLRYGAGVKGKIAEAAAAGIPVVSTTIGVEGMGLRTLEHCLVADEPADFADAVRRLHTDDALWTRLVTGAWAHLSSTLGPRASAAAINATLQSVVPRRWQAAADAPWLGELLEAYTSTWSADDPVLLVLTTSSGDPHALDQALEHLQEVAASQGIDLDNAADIELTASDPRCPVPGRTRLLTEGPPASWPAATAV